MKTAPPRLLIGIGAQKAGTTWLFETLASHPRVSRPPVKEIHYFDHVHLGTRALTRRRQQMAERLHTAYPDEVAAYRSYNRLPDEAGLAGSLRFAFGKVDDDWYRGLSAGRGMFLDLTPAYAVLPREGFAHMRQLSQDLHVIFVLREPVDRMLSQLRFRHRPEVQRYQNRVPRSLDDMDEDSLIALANNKGVVARTAYADTLRKLWAIVPKEHTSVFFYDDLCESPRNFARSVCRAVGLDMESLPGIDDAPLNPSPRHDFTSRVLDEVVRVCRPLTEDLATMIQIPPSWWRSLDR